MQLNELVKLNEIPEFIYSVKVDDDLSSDAMTAPKGLKEIGFILELDDEGTIKENLLDTMISYKLSNVQLLLEVPLEVFKSEQFNANYLISLSSNIGFSIALLPPKHPISNSSCDNHFYCEIIDAVTSEFLNKPNYEHFIYPISSFQEYLVIEQIVPSDKLKDFKPKDEYIIENYLPYMTEKESDDFKAIIRQKIYDHYEGKDNFDRATRETIIGLYQKSKNLLTEHITQQIEQKQQQPSE